MDNFWQNVFGQLHSWWQAVGVFVVGAVATYLINTAANEWTWQGILVSACLAFVTYGFSRVDHKKTEKAVGKAAVTGEVPGKEVGQ